MQSVLYSKQYFKNTLIDCIIVSFFIMSNIYFIQATGWSNVCPTSEGIFFFVV